jgi:hypothetical protein
MRVPVFAFCALLAGPALAQTMSPAPRPLGVLPAPIPVQGGLVVQPLPSATLEEDAPAEAFLQAARQSLAAGRLAEAMEALERAESRALTRDVRPSRADQPSDQKLVVAIGKARATLETGDRLATLADIDAALALTQP